MTTSASNFDGSALMNMVIEWIRLARSETGLPIFIETDWRPSSEDWSPDFEVDHNLALWIRWAAIKSGDITLRALAESLLLEIESISPGQMAEILQNHSRGHHGTQEERDRQGMIDDHWKYENAVRRACIQYFFADKKYTPELSKYQSALARARAGGISSESAASVEKYLETERWIQKIYQATKGIMAAEFNAERRGMNPTSEDVASACAAAVADAHRRADKTVSARLALAFSPSGN